MLSWKIGGKKGEHAANVCQEMTPCSAVNCNNVVNCNTCRTIRDSWTYYNLRQRIITIYDSLAITILDNCYCNLGHVLQCTTTIITIYDIQVLQSTTTVTTIYDRYYNLRQLLLQFTTGITIQNIITIHDRTHHQ